MFDVGTEPDGNLIQHLKECPECRAYYGRCSEAVNLLTPKHIPSVPVSKKHKKKTRNFLQGIKVRRVARYFSYAAVVGIVCAVGMEIYGAVQTKAKAATVAGAFDSAIAAVSSAEIFSAVLNVRTLPDENFSYVSVDAPFVEHRVKVVNTSENRMWRIDKEGGRHVVCDGKAQYLWFDNSVKAFVSGKDANMLEIFSAVVDMKNLMEYEKTAVEHLPGSSYKVEKNDTVLVLTIDAAQEHYEHPVLNFRKSLGEFHNMREYVFSTDSGRLLSMKYWVVVNGSRILILESRGFCYTPDLHVQDIVAIPRSEHIWIDLRHDLHIDSGRLTMLRNETPENAAQRILSAVFRGDTEIAREAMFLYEPALMNYLRDYEFVGCKDVIHPGGLPDRAFVVTDVRTPQGENTELVFSIRKDIAGGFWIVDGGL